MSCGNPHTVPCAEVLDRVYEYIDGELDAPAAHRIRHHLDECSPCLQEFGLDEAVKAIVRRSCSDPAPIELRSKVLLRIASARTELRRQS